MIIDVSRRLGSPPCAPVASAEHENLAAQSNGLLTSLAGLDNLVSVGGSLQISQNAALATLDGLGVEAVAGSLFVSSCAELTSLSGLSLLQTVGAGLTVNNCPKLTTLQGIQVATVPRTLTLTVSPSAPLGLCARGSRAGR